MAQEMRTRERLGQRITPEEHQALAEALEMRPEDIDPEDAYTALRQAARRGQGDVIAGAYILLDAGVIMEVRRA